MLIEWVIEKLISIIPAIGNLSKDKRDVADMPRSISTLNSSRRRIMSTHRLSILLTPFILLLCVHPAAAQSGDWRTIEFETTEVTQADVALSPDGQWLVFTLLGHLFHLPVEGGTAEQLTFGPYYDTDHAISPDGSRVAFVSDRDGSEGNIFVLELATGQITQVTQEAWAGRPTWTPDGQAIVYLRRFAHALEPVLDPPILAPEALPAVVCRVPISGGEPETLTSKPQGISSVFYLPDGRLAWSVIELEITPETGSTRTITRIEVMSPKNTVSSLRTFAGYAAAVVPTPEGHGLYVRRFSPLDCWGCRPPAELLFVPLTEGSERRFLLLTQPLGWTPRFAVSAGKKNLYLGDGGRLWKVLLPSGSRELIPFRARVRLEILEPLPPLKQEWVADGHPMRPRSILDPVLSPDGGTLIFEAAGHLWRQPLGGGAAQRLLEGGGVERHPSFSPDGRQLAFVHSQHGKKEVRVLHFHSGETQTLAAGQFISRPSWSPDGQHLVYREGLTFVTVNLDDGKKDQLGEVHDWWWSSRPHFSPNGQSLYFTENRRGRGGLYRLRLEPGATPQAVTQLARHLSDGLVSSDGKWLAFRRNWEIWVAPLGTESITEEHVQRFSVEGGESFSFAPDGSALIYSTGNRVWRHSLVGGVREEIPIHLELQRPTPTPLLLQRVRVLDFASGGFGPETSLFIEQGRIRWIDSEQGRSLPPETRILDAGGRFAIPGLFDLHVHGFHAEGALLAYGVTSVRNTAAALMRLNAEADREGATNEPLPRVFFSGELFDGEQPGWGDSYLIIDNEDDARAYVQRFKQRGAHFLKVYFSLPYRLQRVVAEEARRHGLPIAWDGMHVEGVVKGVTLGFSSYEHTNAPTRLYDDVLQLLAAAGTAWDPTLTKIGGPSWMHDEPERFTDAKSRALSGDWVNRWAEIELGLIGASEARGRLALQLASLRAAHQRGVKVWIGSDWPLAAALHWELENFVQAGIPPLEVLRIATQEGAAAVGADDDLGTLAPGKLADIVLLNANPIEDIKNTQAIWRVIKGGWVFDPEELQARTDR